jgi:hypothetical protein
MRRSWIISAVVISATSIACTALLGDFNTSNAVPEPGAEGGPNGIDSGMCNDTQKTCNGACVSKTDPNAGCATAVCTPCAAATNAVPACKAGGCAFTCNDGFSDCDGNPANGCEGKTSSDVLNCGTCGDPCGAANTTNVATCTAGKCVFMCKMNFAHCGPTNATGCETDLDNDKLNCGACGHSCLGGACKVGKCQPVQIASTSQPSGLAVDKTHVYFAAPSLNRIDRVQRDGTCMPAMPCPQAFAGSDAGDPPANLVFFRGPSAIVSDGMDVYWTAAAGVVKRSAALPPGAFKSIAPAVTTNPGYLALGGGKVWWTTGFATADPAPHLRNVAPDGSNLTTFAFYPAPYTSFMGRGGVATDATSIYWAAEKGGNVYRAAFTDPPCTEGFGAAVPCKGFGNATSPYAVAVDDTYVYWADPTGGTIKRATKIGGSPVYIATNQDNPYSIAVLDGFVYWGNGNINGPTSKTIRRTPSNAALCDGLACEKVADVSAPDSIIAADDGIYWVDDIVAGGVFRLAK